MPSFSPPPDLSASVSRIGSPRPYRRNQLALHGPGCIGVECRDGDGQVIEWLRSLHDEETALRVTAERAMNERLQGGCQVPIAGFAELDGGRLWLRGLVGTPDGSQVIRGEITGPCEEAKSLGFALAEELLSKGADRILRELYS